MNDRDRRTNPRTAPPGAAYMDCRLCWRRIKLEPERVEIVDYQVAYRCQHCDSSFLIRRGDAVSIGADVAPIA